MKVFINYRRDDTDDLAGRLYDRLLNEFGSENLFKDVDSIRPGQNWKMVLEQSVANCDVVLALIGKQWIGCVDDKGNQRLSNENDWVRYELEAANRNRRIVMPVLVKGAPVPRLEQLPESLHWLPEIHVIEIRGDPFFKDDVTRLVVDLRRLGERIAEQARLAEQARQAEQERLARLTQPGPGAVITAGGEGAGGIVCPGCKRLCPRSDQFCEGCGSPLWDRCPKCTNPVAAGVRFCKHCAIDIPMARQAEAAYSDGQSRLAETAAIADAATRLAKAESLLTEVDAAGRAVPDHAPLAQLRRDVQHLAWSAARSAAEIESASGRYGAALGFYARLATIGGAAPDVSERVEAIRARHAQKLKEALSFMGKGSYKQASVILVELRSAFPEDTQIADLEGRCQHVLERSTRLLGGELRSLQVMRRLVELEREIKWLEAQHINVPKLASVVKPVRARLASANELAARAAAELRAGNPKSASRFARSVLAAVADHEGALEIVRTTGGLTQHVAQLDRLAESRQWIDASAILQSLDEGLAGDPRLAELSAEICEATAKVRSSARQFKITVLVLLLAGLVLVPFANTESRSGTWDPSGILLIWLAGSFLILGMLWWGFADRTQVWKCLITGFRTRRHGRVKAAKEAHAGASSSEFSPLIDVTKIEIAPLPEIELSAQDNVSNTESAGGKAGKLISSVVLTGDLGPHPQLDRSASLPSLPTKETTPTNPLAYHQHLEATAMAFEWLILGGIVSVLVFLVSIKLVNAMGPSRWAITAMIGAQALALLPVALLVVGATQWRVLCAITTGMILAVCGIPFLPLNELSKWFELVPPALYILGLGLLTAAIFGTPLWRGAAAAIGGVLIFLLLGFLSSFIWEPLLGLIVPKTYDKLRSLEEFSAYRASEGTLASVGFTSVAWSMWILVACSALGTIARRISTSRLRLREICAYGLAAATGIGVLLVVMLFAAMLGGKWLWIASWIVFLAASQATPRVLRWEWRQRISILSVGAAVALVAFMALAEWLAPAAAEILAGFTAACVAVIIMNVKTIDVYTHGKEVWARIQTRMRARRLPIKISVGRS